MSLLLAPYLRPPSNPRSSSNSSFSSSLTGRSQRTLVSAMHCGTSSAQTRTEKDSCGWLMCRANWQSQRVRYFLRPTKLSWSRKENVREGTQTPGWIYSQTRLTGSERPTKTATHLARSRRVQSAYSSALSALKKWLVANLSAKRQLSVAKLSAKRNVSLAKRDFLVANGRMAADFSSPDFGTKTQISLDSLVSWREVLQVSALGARHRRSSVFRSDAVSSCEFP